MTRPRPDLVENLAASIYKQGEAANAAGDYRAAANHFLRIKEVAPTSKIRAGAQYDAGAALMRLQDWKAAAQVLDEFRRDNPTHELVKDATKQIANAFQQAGDLGGAAGEYERVANEATDPALRAEALLLAGKLHEDAKDTRSRAGGLHPLRRRVPEAARRRAGSASTHGRDPQGAWQ